VRTDPVKLRQAMIATSDKLAESKLQPLQFMHATRADVQPGEFLQSPNARNVEPTNSMMNKEGKYVFAGRGANEIGNVMAMMAPGRSHPEYKNPTKWLAVTPLGKYESDPGMGAEGKTKSIRSEHAMHADRVIDVEPSQHHQDLAADRHGFLTPAYDASVNRVRRRLYQDTRPYAGGD
jgi:hypothetical protein